jgi:hypothetical protein
MKNSKIQEIKPIRLIKNIIHSGIFFFESNLKLMHIVAAREVEMKQ